jgi:hypothetical protein
MDTTVVPLASITPRPELLIECQRAFVPHDQTRERIRNLDMEVESSILARLVRVR